MLLDSVEETLRIIDTWQFHEENGEVCPDHWHKGEAAIKPIREGVLDYLSKK
jgi:peroxiredoxin (alkyl hydroperoxide reductase subunit C)